MFPKATTAVFAAAVALASMGVAWSATMGPVSSACAETLSLAGGVNLLAPAESAAFIVAINQIRSQLGLGSLQVDQQITAVAQSWADSMATAGGISHRRVSDPPSPS